MGLNFGCKEQCSKFLQYQPNTCHWSIHQLKKNKPVFAGKCIAVAVACVGKAAEPKEVRRRISFPAKNRAECTCWPYWCSYCEICTCHCQGFEINENLGGKGVTFGADITAPFVAFLPAAGSGAPASLCWGGCDRRAVATPRVPLGIRSFHHGCGRSMRASSYCFSHGWRKVDQKHCKKKAVVRWYSRSEMLFELSHENTGLQALHLNGKAKQFMYCQESNLVISSSPVTKIMYRFIGILLFMKRKEISSSAPGLSMMTLSECRVDHPFPVTWLGKVWDPPPPPAGQVKGLFNPRFPGLNFRYRNAVTRTWDWLFWFSLIYIFIDYDIIPFCNFKIGE
jgi:hypothetical protein